jgi:hypothetical protein
MWPVAGYKPGAIQREQRSRSILTARTSRTLRSHAMSARMSNDNAQQFLTIGICGIAVFVALCVASMVA